MFLPQDCISHTRIYRVIKLIVARLQLQFFSNDIFINLKKNLKKIHMDSEKLRNSFEIKKDRLPDYLLNNYFFNYLLITFRYCFYAK